MAEKSKKAKDRHFFVRMALLVVSAAGFAYAGACILINVDEKKLGYHETGKVDYTVCLKPNDFFVDACQPASKQYVASLIDHLQTRFAYDFRADSDVQYDYRYRMFTRLVATEVNNPEKVLYENEEVILPEKSAEGQTGQGVTIDEKVQLNYGKYNDLVMAFRTEYGLTLEAYVVVGLNVELDAKHADFRSAIHTSEQIALKIPLSERTINVSMQSDELNRVAHVTDKSRDFGKNWGFVALAGGSGLVFLAVAAISLTIWVQRYRHCSWYEKKLRAILREYNQLIVEVENLPKLPKSQTIEVASFEELLDAHDTILRPILHLQTDEDNSLFVIEDGEMAYVYALGVETSRLPDKLTIQPPHEQKS
ncbi:MAG: DUF5305 domain-containing protein [Candidatus Nomurabacteria bacterium]|jgi:hypothetical protein|nr:DUF5305 domain-containing protein [Candidatus Nomurabacteria bacterium]